MGDPVQERQQSEIEALQGIYDTDFLEAPPPKAWKGAVRLTQFVINVTHPQHPKDIRFHLHVTFPRTYPEKATPVFTIQKPILGLSNDHITSLSHIINSEAQRHKGSETVFNVVSFAQEWMNENVVQASGSLATQMNQRAMDAEAELKKRRADEAALKAEREAQRVEALNKQIQAETLKQQEAKARKEMQEQSLRKGKHRIVSGGDSPMSTGDVSVESFPEEIEYMGFKFRSVKVYRPVKECLGTTYLADPICDDVHASLPLELHVTPFTSPYYQSGQGFSKVEQVEGEIRRYMKLHHVNLIRVLAVKIAVVTSDEPMKLLVLSEQRPFVTLEDILQDCDALKEDKAVEYLTQCLAALNVIHTANLIHRGIEPKCIGLAPRDTSSNSGAAKYVKISRAVYHSRLQDLHRSNPFGNVPLSSSPPDTPEGWLSKDVLDSPLIYTKARDIHALGLVLIMMLLGLDVIHVFPDVQSALQSSNLSPAVQRHVMSMLHPTKKIHTSCLGLLSEVSGLATPAKVTFASKAHSVTIADPKTPRAWSAYPNNSPDTDYFHGAQRTRQASRWKEDWEELELLGKGAFGSVVKARNKVDSRVYAVKKIKLKTSQKDNKIFREVNALSRLSHRFIVRYYTTWVETTEPSAAAFLLDSTSDSEMSQTTDGLTSVPDSRSSRSNSHYEFKIGEPFSVDLNDLDEVTNKSQPSSSFPSIHFGSGSSPGDTDSDDSEIDEDIIFGTSANHLAVPVPLTPTPRPRAAPPQLQPAPTHQILYIQMEFVERQTLRERVAEGISEAEAWRLFQQILDALTYMSSLAILHRDIKLTNIFIDGNGDCKVGDFGLATSSLAAVDPSDVQPQARVPDADMTLEVGTKLYIAPEVSGKRRSAPRNHSNADMYSLGILFFEMNYQFHTGSERIRVIEDLRKPEIKFPESWNPQLDRQKQIIKLLLAHNPAERPTALQLAQNPLLPPRVEDENFKGALRLIAKPDSPHHQTVLEALFNPPVNLVRAAQYDVEAERPEHASLNEIVQERMTTLLRLRGAVDMTPPLLLPVTDPQPEGKQVIFLDRHGEVVMLPSNPLLPFARQAARANIRRIKRYHIGDIYKTSPVPGHPKVFKAAMFDIITTDLESGAVASTAEVLSVINDVLNSFPTLSESFDIHLCHSDVAEMILKKVSGELQSTVIEMMGQTRLTSAQKRAYLLKKGLLRSVADELELLSELDGDIESLPSRMEKLPVTLANFLKGPIDEIKRCIELARFAGFPRPVHFQSCVWGSRHDDFKGGVRVEVVRKTRRHDVLAAAGRYESMITQSFPSRPIEATCAVGMQIDLEKIAAALATFQSTSVKSLIKEQKSFGYWSPRRCDVYVVSYQQGTLQERLEIVGLLWQNGIMSDYAYEAGVDADSDFYDVCIREGILFTVAPRARSQQMTYKVKSVLKGTEHDVTRHELISFLQQQLAEQKRLDASTSGLAGPPDAHATSQLVVPTKESSFGIDAVQVLLQTDSKKQRKHVKTLLYDRAFDKASKVKQALQNTPIQTLAIDVPPQTFDLMCRNTAWLTDEDAWRAVVASCGHFQVSYTSQIREAVTKRKNDGNNFVMMFSIKEGRIQILDLTM